MTGSTEEPAEPMGTATTKSSAAKPRDAARTSDGCCARCVGTDFRCLQEAFLKGRHLAARRATLGGCVPATSKESFFLQLPRGRHALRRPSLTGQRCRSEGNAETSNLLISQQLASLERWELSRDFVRFASDPASHSNPQPPHKTSSIYLLLCLAPKAK